VNKVINLLILAPRCELVTVSSFLATGLLEEERSIFSFHFFYECSAQDGCYRIDCYTEYVCNK
jgi:hypothetical protein